MMTSTSQMFWRVLGSETCPECDGVRQRRQMFQRVPDSEDRAIGTPILFDCPCRIAKSAEIEVLRADRERQQQRVAAVSRAKATAEIGSRFALRTFENFVIEPGNEAAYDMAREVAHRMVARGADGEFAGVRGGVIVGPYGVGKSHLLAAVVNACTAEGIGAVFATSSKIVKAVWASRNNEAAIRFGTCPILALDDIGREPDGANSARTMLDVLNIRYENRLPVIGSSNMSISELIMQRYAPFGDDGAAMLDRLRALGNFPWVNITGDSHRGAEPA